MREEIIDKMYSLITEEKEVAPENCEQCMACDNPPVVGVRGDGRKGIMFVLPSPTKAEAENGEIGQSTQYAYLKTEVAKFGLSLDRDFWVTTAYKNYPYAKTPNKKQLNSCRHMLQEEIHRLSPKVIVPIGRHALFGLVGHKMHVIPSERKESATYDSALYSFIGWEIPDHEYKSVIVPFFNLYDIFSATNMNLKSKKGIRSILPQKAFQILKKISDGSIAYSKDVINTSVQVYTEKAEAINELIRFNLYDEFALDYETTGKAPYRKGQRIISISLSTHNRAVSFPIFYDCPEFMERLRILLTNDAEKIAHNMKFEYNWTRKILGHAINNLSFDTMLVAHILDNRPSITGLKFQSFIHFGITEYGDKSKKLFSSLEDKDDVGVNALSYLYYLDENNIAGKEKVIWDTLLEYGALDAKLTFWLYEKQKKELNRKPLLKAGVKLFHEGTLAFADIEYSGMKWSRENTDESYHTLTREIEDSLLIIKNSNEYKFWVKVKGKPLNLNSSPQLQEWLFNLLGYTPTKLTGTGKPSTDKDSLADIGIPVTDEILRYKGLLKLRDTFIKSYEREEVDGRVHASFGLNTVQTYRSSSFDPNLMQVAKRNPDAKYVRRTLTANNGHQLLEADFKSVEVGISACYHKDTNMINYIIDENTDMHRDTACDIFFYTHEDLPKHLRQLTKGAFVFAQFYGSYWGNCAPDLWKGIDNKEKARLATFGINNYEDFMWHIRDIEEKFWQERFPEYYAWRLSQWDTYVQEEEIPLYTGFTCTNLMDSKQVSNYPIQGSAFHCLLKTIIKVNNYIQRNKLESRIVVQVHDSLIISVKPEEKDIILQAIQNALVEIHREWEWIITPLIIEYETSPVDGTWADLSAEGKIYTNKIVKFS